MARASKHRDPPTLTINVGEQFAWLRVALAMGWKGDPRKMDQALAAIASKSLGILRDHMNRAIAVPSAQVISRALDLSEDELSRTAGVLKFYQSYCADPALSYNQLDREIFFPAGHHHSATAAPALEQQLDELQSASGKAYFAGMLLLVIAKLHEYHTDIPASLNRAVAVVEAAWIREHGRCPSSLMDIWTDWRHLAPLWAAYAVEFRNALASGLTADAAEKETLHDPLRLRRVVGGAEWFRRFAEVFSAKRAQTCLIPHGVALHIISDIGEMKPDLQPLVAEDLAAAKAYQAPTKKFFSQARD